MPKGRLFKGPASKLIALPSPDRIPGWSTCLRMVSQFNMLRWAREACAPWLAFLEDNPSAFDSLDILDDLATALGLLAHRIHLANSAGQAAEAVHRLEQYLILGPGDSHGFRGLLIERQLRRGDNESALEIAERFPDDVLVETSMGRVLALCCPGRLEEAAAAFESTHTRNAHLIECW